MKQCLTIIYVLIFLSNQSNSTPLVKGKVNNNKDISLYTHGMFKAFTPNNGLPQSSIMAMAVDKSGYLWIGTQDGAAYYDGRKWTTI